jgi:prolyl oligopeptidase
MSLRRSGIRCEGKRVKHSPDRRRLLAQYCAAWTLSTLPPRLLAAVPRAPARPPVARVERVVEEVFGTRVVDNYRWMENARDPDWLPFLQGQNKYARAVLDALPGHAALARRIAALSGDTAASYAVRAAGERLFYEQRPAGADHYMLFVREAGRPERVLIDPAALKSGDMHAALDWWVPSFDGRHVVYGLSLAGSEASVLHVMAVDSGAVLPERIEMTDAASPAWLPDGSGFFYIQLTGQRGTPTLYQHSVVKLHRLSTDPGSDAIVMGSGRDPAVPIEPLQFTRIVTAPEAAQALAIVFDVRTEFALYVTPLDMLSAGRPQWRRVADFDALITAAALVGDALYLLSNRGAVRGRVLRVPLAAPDLERATVVMPQGATVIDELAGARDGVYVRLMDGGVHRLARIGRDDKVVELALPFEGGVSRMAAAGRHLAGRRRRPHCRHRPDTTAADRPHAIRSAAILRGGARRRARALHRDPPQGHARRPPARHPCKRLRCLPVLDHTALLAHAVAFSRCRWRVRQCQRAWRW